MKNPIPGDLPQHNKTGHHRMLSVERWFKSHPQAVGESYLQHQFKALSFAYSLMVITVAAIVHALVPGLCQHTVRDRVANLHARLQARSHLTRR